MSDFFTPAGLRHFGHRCLLYAPDWLVRYASANVDSIPKFVNHILMAVGACDLFLLFASWPISSGPFFAAFLLCCQNACSYIILNHDTVSFAPRSLAPTEFMVGVCLGILIGGAILAFFISRAFRKLPAYCDLLQGDHLCSEQKGNMGAVWWWSTLIFWLDLVSCMLIAIGRQEFIRMTNVQYENIDSGVSMEFAQGSQFNRARETQAAQQQSGTSSATTTSFVGNYANIPEVQTAASSQSTISTSAGPPVVNF